MICVCSKVRKGGGGDGRGKSLVPVKIEGWIFARLNHNLVTIAELCWLRNIKICNTKILPLVLLGYENWPLVLSENHSSRTLSTPIIWQCPKDDDEFEAHEQTDITSPQTCVYLALTTDALKCTLSSNICDFKFNVIRFCEILNNSTKFSQQIAQIFWYTILFV